MNNAEKISPVSLCDTGAGCWHIVCHRSRGPVTSSLQERVRPSFGHMRHPTQYGPHMVVIPKRRRRDKALVPCLNQSTMAFSLLPFETAILVFFKACFGRIVTSSSKSAKYVLAIPAPPRRYRFVEPPIAYNASVEVIVVASLHGDDLPSDCVHTVAGMQLFSASPGIRQIISIHTTESAQQLPIPVSTRSFHAEFEQRCEQTNESSQS